MLQLIENAKNYLAKTAIIDSKTPFTYADLLQKSQQIATVLLDGSQDLEEKRVAFMISPGFDYVAVQWAIWRAGGIAVPLCITYPLPSLQYVIEDTQAAILVVGREYEELLSPYQKDSSLRYISFDSMGIKAAPTLPMVDSARGAMILYTSGTTSLPKGVLTTHANIEAQVNTLVHAWKWCSTDYTIGILPLHHVHGIINVLSCSLWAGATIEFLHPFSSDEVFELLETDKITVFMAVPTIYYKLIASYEGFSQERKEKISAALERLRLMVSGSAALPVSTMSKWKEISGHYLLERYGMTEIGMAISNPYHHDRRAGYIGQALEGVEIRLVDEQNNVVWPGHPGEIQVKGPSVFKAYWGKPEATQKSFTEDGWFKTGDIAVIEEGYFRILGRDSIDIIKSGGYKISAIEIEEKLRQYPGIQDVAVLGIPDEEWGELIVAVLVVNFDLESKEISQWLREQMPAYKTPRTYHFIEELPRNAMGKVTKNELKKLF
jgi:malonyl-CoA/methylmalonyl-CoA synthetase